MTDTTIRLSRKKPENFDGDMLIYTPFVNDKEKIISGQIVAEQEFNDAVSIGDFDGKYGDTLLLYPAGNVKKKIAVRRVFFAGLGNVEKKNDNETRELLRKTGGLIAKEAGATKSTQLGICLESILSCAGEAGVESLVEGILLGDYRFVKYKSKSKKKEKGSFTGIKEIVIFSSGSKSNRKILKGIKRAVNSATAACKARDMANEPGNGWTPTSFAVYARSLAGKYKMTCTVLGKGDMKRLKMGGLLGVNQGSSEPPKLVILEYKSPKKEADTILFVGKGLTFDSGGVSLKPSAGMQDMKYDMCGGAAALSAMSVVGAEQPDVNVIAIIPATDNMGGSSALKPGDIIKHYGGITSEIVNTDAEGRLILADSLAYGIKRYKPTCVVDLATLTGAVILGLGHHRTGLLGNSQELIDRIVRAGDKSGEPLWQLPLDEEYTEQIESDVADIKNSGGRPAGTITAAAYLQKFVGKIPWVHLDIAGTAWDFTKKSYIPKGPSGIAVRTLVELVRDWKKFS